MVKKGNIPWNKGKKGVQKKSEATKKKLRGKIPWNKGKTGVYSEATKKAMGAKNIGREQTEEQKKALRLGQRRKPTEAEIEKIRISNTGQKRTKEQIENIKKAVKAGYENGREPSNKGISPSLETRKKISESNKGKPAPNKGIPMSEEQREKMEPVWAAHRNYKHTDEAIENIRVARLNQVFPPKDTFPEVYIQKLLVDAKIEFEKHVPLMGQPDIFIKPNFLIFSDGDYWHCNPKPHFKWNYKIPSNLEDLTSSDMNSLLKGKKMEPGWEPNQTLSGGQTAKMKWASDKKVTKTLMNKGYIVLRFWDSEFFGKPAQCIEKILKAIKKSK